MQNLKVEDVAKILNRSPQSIRVGIQRKAFPWATCFKGKSGKYIYVIYPKLFWDYIGEPQQ